MVLTKPKPTSKSSKVKTKSHKKVKKAYKRQQIDDTLELEEITDEDLLEDEESNAAKLKEQARKRRHAERFIRLKMWVSILVSKFNNDRGTIPSNIGNNILITNNQYTTKNHISQMILVREMSEYTPLMWMSDLVQEVKDSAEDILIDITVKNMPYFIDLNESGMNSRLRTWHMTLDNPLMSKESVRRAARCLFTYDVLKTHVKLYKGYTYIIIRATSGAKLRKGVEAVCAYLGEIGASYQKINSNIEEHMQFSLIMSDKRPDHLKDVAPVIYSTETLAQSLPGVQGMNNTRGVLCGMDMISGYPYFIDFKRSSNAKNIFVQAGSGWGKTFITTSFLYAFYADNFSMGIVDLKGTEYEALTKALHGVTISLRQNTHIYINTFVWNSNEKFDRDATTYAHEQLQSSKTKMLIMANLDKEETSVCEALIDEFLDYLYTIIGAIPENENTWSRTNNLTPYIVFDYFERYLSHEIQNKYPKVAKKALERLRIYMSSSGSSSHIFRTPLSYKSIFDTRVLRFDFGIMEGASADTDPVIFKMHVLDMSLLMDQYGAHKKKLHEWSTFVLEESQVAGDYLLEIYTRMITLKRAGNQVNLLLGNSIAALERNDKARPMLDNLNILLLGSLNKSSRRYLKEEWGLNEDEVTIMEDLQVNPDMDHAFLLVNRMQKDATTAVIRAGVSEEVANSSLFRVVDTEDD